MKLPSRIPDHLRGIPKVAELDWFYPKNLLEVCTCGRDNQRIHCPTCGSTNLIGTVGQISVRVINGQQMLCNGYTCRRCGCRFDTGDLLKCEAPNLHFKTMADKREYDQAQENLEALEDPEQRTKLLTKLLFKKDEAKPNAK